MFTSLYLHKYLARLQVYQSFIETRAAASALDSAAALVSLDSAWNCDKERLCHRLPTAAVLSSVHAFQWSWLHVKYSLSSFVNDYPEMACQNSAPFLAPDVLK